MKVQNIEEAQKYNRLSYKEIYDPHLLEYYKKQFYTKRVYEKEFYVLQGEIHLHQGNYEQAEKSILKAFEGPVKRDGDQITYKTQKMYHLSKIAFQKNDYQEVVNLLEEGKPQDSTFFHNYLELDDYYLVLAKSYSKLEKEKEASRYLHDYIDIVELNRSEKNEITRKIQQKEIVQVQEELARLETSKQSAERRLLYGGGSVLLILIVIGQRFYRTHKRNKKRFKDVLKKLEQKEYELVLNNTNKSTQIQTEYNLRQELIDTLKKGLKRIEKTEYFLRKECTQVTVAKKLKTNTAYLSKFMNSQYGFGFNTYLNNLRIHYAIQRLKNDKIFRSYTVQAISEELGYKSSNTFTKAFKKETGLLPSYYIRELTLLEER
jgi:AraC-like DNA-binding protein